MFRSSCIPRDRPIHTPAQVSPTKLDRNPADLEEFKRILNAVLTGALMIFFLWNNNTGTVNTYAITPPDQENTNQ
jgi:hypothetical protein